MATSYSNIGGSGARYAFIIVTSDCPWNGDYAKLLINGGYEHTIWFSSTSSVTDKYIKFEFPTSVVIDEAKWYQDSIAQSGTWKWQGSNNDSNWSDIGSSFTLGSSATQTLTTLNGNTTAYKYYRLLGISGNFQNTQYIQEIEFKIEAYTYSYLDPTFGSGNRTGNITVSFSGATLFDGNASELVDGSFTLGVWYQSSQDVSDDIFKFDFGVGNAPIINEAIWIQDVSNTHGTWRWAGSNNDSNWTNIGNSFTLGGVRNVHTELNGNTTGYRYYKLFGVSGNSSNIPWLSEIIFSIAEEAVDHSVITLKYKTGATSALCEVATYQEYTVPFDSEGFVQLRVEG